MEAVLEFIGSDGLEVVVPLPDDTSERSGQLVDAAASAIFNEFQTLVTAADRVSGRSGGKSPRATKKTLSWIRPLAYQLIVETLRYGLEHHLYRRSVEAGRYASGGAGSANVFQLCLMGILADRPSLLADDERQQTGLILGYAYRHYVPMCFVNAFANQVGRLDATRAATGFEDHFDDWIVRERVLDVVPQKARGKYPRRVEDRIKLLRRQNATFIGNLLGGQPVEMDDTP